MHSFNSSQFSLIHASSVGADSGGSRTRNPNSIVSSAAYDDGATTGYQYDGDNVVGEFSVTNALTASVSSLGADGWLSRTEGATSRQFLTDALGSVIATTDSSGALKTQYTHEPYGRTTVAGEVSSNPYQYTGRENDGTGLYYYRARYYNPSFQRFMSTDQIGLSGGLNTYEYAFSNPLSLTDP